MASRLGMTVGELVDKDGNVIHPGIEGMTTREFSDWGVLAGVEAEKQAQEAENARRRRKGR